MAMCMQVVSNKKEFNNIVDRRQNVDDNDNKSRYKQQATTTLYDLSEEMIQTTVAYFTPYYIVSHRHDFALYFSGATSYAKISEDSKKNSIAISC
jgi:hypothetical protein